MKKKKLKIIVILVVCVVCAFLLSSALRPESTETPENRVVSVQRGDLVVNITASGNLELSDKRSLSFGTSGTVEEVLVEEGDSITKGQVLARINAPGLEASFAIAELDLRQTIYPFYRYTKCSDLPGTWLALAEARDNLEQAQELLKEGKSDEAQLLLENVDQSLDEAEDKSEARAWSLPFAIKRLEIAYDHAKSRLDEAKITAPFDGIITKVNVDAGQGIKADTVAMEIARTTEFEVNILVSEMDIFQVSEGKNATVQIDALSGKSFPAQVTYISPTATVVSGVVNFDVEVEIQPLEAVAQEQENQEEGEQQSQTLSHFQLREGLSVVVNLPVAERNDVLLIPNSAITTLGGKIYVQVVSPNGTAEERIIQTGISDWQYTEVTDGLSEDEQVVVPEDTTTTKTSRQELLRERLRMNEMR